jgi:hypothetical protein
MEILSYRKSPGAARLDGSPEITNQLDAARRQMFMSLQSA